MYLKQLKLAGFKSFVDSTVVHFPSHLVAVVGPNGCGKSNIIDAVRWVMGERSIRNLRGESTTDIIFNGSSNRKSVGQALVELVFDNSLGRLTGPFAHYGEIAIKRVVTRDGDSSYYLNGSRCRRKDITDIFLGTGAGARGYSIIGQGTISQLIEAKPEDLRVFLEEAAGVSQYKERRKETVQRIAHTRDNLTRIADIRDELDKQLQRLERQAKAAARYLILKKEERLCRAEILALKWQEFVRQQELKQRELHELVGKHAEYQNILTKAHTERIISNEKQHDVEEQTQQIQATFYHLRTEIARLEEIIQQQVRERNRLDQDQQRMQADWQIAKEQLKYDQEELVRCQNNAQNLEKHWRQLKAQFKAQEVQWQEAQKQQADYDVRWQEVQMQSNNLKREFQVAQVNAQHVQQKKQHIVLRLEKLQLEQKSISVSDGQLTKKNLVESRTKILERLQFDELQLKQRQESAMQFRVKAQETEQQLHQFHDEFHNANSEHAALVAAQRAARQCRQNNTAGGIKEWSIKSRLMDVLQVETKWQIAGERVLNETLYAYVLETFDELWPQQEQCKLQGESVVTLSPLKKTISAHPRLSDKIQGSIPANATSLDDIFAAEDWEEALSWLPDLAAHQSVVTPDGFWLGKGWVKFAPNKEKDELGFLARQQKIAHLAKVVEELQGKIAIIKIQREQYHHELQKNINEVELQQRNVNASNDALRTNSVALSTLEHELLHAEKLAASLIQECDELHMTLEETTIELLMAHSCLQELESQCIDYELQEEQCRQEKQEGLEVLASKSKQVEGVRSVLHQVELENECEKNKMQQLGERINREQERLNILQERLEHLAMLCLQTKQPGTELQEQLGQQLLKHSEIELQLARSREQLVQLRREQDELEKNILNCDFAAKQLQEFIGQARMEEQAFAVRASSVQEVLDELGVQAPLLLEGISEGMTQAIREDELIGLTEKIQRLGVINLTAIEEFTTEQQRKIYLGEQYNDLCEALATLETAIEKMDKETRLRLEHTFSEVNTSFKALFPRLFGGGRAQLELTCENLLEAGIVVMAQPPGKRNSTIHLLSGGEKAMTAIALVFAIFQLNPSPFCMLDEVDAPLDDVNVGRFCALVKEMSQFVQFLFITHNKITMELADHLIGVTMREPGVSRLVTVDVIQALAME